MSWRRLTERKFLLDWREGRWSWPSWEKQSFEEIVQELVDRHQRLPLIHRAARFCNSWMPPRLWGFHTTAAYSIVGLIWPYIQHT